MATTETLLTSVALDYEEFSEAIEGADGEIRLTARDEAPWLQDLLSIDGIVLQVMQKGGPIRTWPKPRTSMSPGSLDCQHPFGCPSTVRSSHRADWRSYGQARS